MSDDVISERWSLSKQEKKPKHSSRNERFYLNTTRLTDPNLQELAVFQVGVSAGNI